MDPTPRPPAEDDARPPSPESPTEPTAMSRNPPLPEPEAPAPSLADLYEDDETAWLDTMSRLAAERRFEELDCDHLSEFLADMARRDRREVLSRLETLLLHLLKWEHQPDRRSGSWQSTIIEQRRRLKELLESGTLRNHAGRVLEEAYRGAFDRASAETGLDEGSFPPSCPYTLEAILGEEGEPSSP